MVLRVMTKTMRNRGTLGSASKGVSEKVTKHCFSWIVLSHRFARWASPKPLVPGASRFFPACFNIFHMDFPWIVIIFLLQSPANGVLQGFFCHCSCVPFSMLFHECVPWFSIMIKDMFCGQIVQMRSASLEGLN